MPCTHQLALAAALSCLWPAARALAVEEPDETIVITATRTERRLDRVGSSITVIDAEDIERHQDRLVIDALERVPGITVRRSSNRPGSQASIFMRGANSDQTLVLVDGVRLHDPSSPGRTAFLDHLGVEDIERIEVLAGPQSVLYGSEAIGGVINIITRRGSGPPRAIARFDAGSYNTFDSALAVRGGGDRQHYSLSLTHTDSDGFSARSNPAENDDDGYSRIQAALRLGIGDSDLGLDGSFRLLEAETEIDGFGAPATDSRQYALALSPHAMLLDGKWEQRGTYSLHRTRRQNGGPGATEFVGTLHDLDWVHTLRPVESLTTVIGGRYHREVADFAASDENADAGSVYLDQQIELGEFVDLTGGLRVELHERFGADVTWRVTAAARLWATGASLHSSIGTGFKAPTLFQLFDNSFGTANANLEPERSFGWDLGVRHHFGSRASVDLTWFGNEIDDVIESVFVPPFTSLPNANIESVSTDGIELKIEVLLLDDCRWLGDLTAQLAYTRLTTKARDAVSFGIVNGGRLLRRPDHEVFSSFAWLPTSKLELTLGILYVGDRLDFGPVGSYVKVDLAATIHVSDRLKLFGRTENIGNEQYEDVAGFETSGRAYYAGFRFEFP